MRRTQVYLDEQQHRALAARARALGRSPSDLIREAVEALLLQPLDDTERLRRFRAAVHAAAGVAPDLPPGEQYVEEIRAADRDRAEALERQWHG